MLVPDNFYRFLYSVSDYQENIEFDANGNEVYHGIAPNSSASADPSWVIFKGIYTTVVIDTITVYLLTHTSCLRGQIWANRASISFP